MSIKVYSGTTALKAIRERPDKVLTLSKKKTDKVYGGATFLDTKWCIEPNNPTDGWFSFTNAPFSKGITNPADIKQGSKEIYESVRLMARFKESKLGDFGTFIHELDAQWQTLVKRSVESGVMTMTKKQEVHNLLCLQSPADAGPIEIFEDPTIKLKLDFTKYSDKHPNEYLKSRVKTLVLDGTKPYVDKSGRTEYEVATITNPDGTTEELSAKNVHKFITSGCIAKYCRVFISSAVSSAGWISMPMLVDKLIILPPVKSGFDDENDDEEDDTPAIKSLSADAPLDAPTNVVATPEAIEELTEMINDL